MDQVPELEPAEEAAPAAPQQPTSTRNTSGRRVDYTEAAKQLMDRCVVDAQKNQPRLDRDRADYLNLLFYRGGRDNQWVVYDRATNSYVPRGTDPAKGGLPEWVPRAVTNILAVKIDGVAAILNQSEPAKNWSPSTDDDEDRATAEVAEDADPVLLDEINYAALRPELNKLACLTNASALILYYDNSPKHGMADMPLFGCPTCGLVTTAQEIEDAGNVCPGTFDEKTGEENNDGCGTSGDEFEQVIQPDGKPAGVPTPKGKICAHVAPSFEFSLPSSARVCDASRVPWLLTHSATAKEELLSRFGDKAKRAIEKAGGARTGGIQRSYARAMRQLASPSRANAPDLGTTGIADDPILYILQHDPIEDEEFFFPDGLHAVMLEGELMEAGPLPIIDDDDRAQKSCLTRTYAQAPGSPFGKPPADDLVPLQVSRNMVDSLIQLILMHDAAPRTFIPLGVTLENQPTGRPGETIYYRSMMPGEAPTTDRGVNPPEGLYRYLEIIDSKFDEISKLNAVLAGERPSGDPTLGEVQRLEENGLRAFKEPLDEQVRFERQLSLLLLSFARQTFWADRARKVRGENGQWEIRQFNAASLAGRVDLQIDSQTAWPKSNLTRMLRIQKALEFGVIPPPAQDPELQAKLLGELDLVDLKASLDVDRKQIARELDAWKAAQTPDQIPPPAPTRQNLGLHLHFKQQFLKTEEFEALLQHNLPLAQAMEQHVMALQQHIAAAQAQAAAAENPQPEKPDNRTPAEKGESSAVQEAVDAGVLTPAGAAPQEPDAMAQALESGALLPAGAAPQPPAGPSIDELAAAGLIVPVTPRPTPGQEAGTR